MRNQGVNMGDDSSGLKRSEAELLHPVPSGSWRQLEAGGPRQVWRLKNGYVTPARSSYMLLTPVKLRVLNFTLREFKNAYDSIW